MKNECRLFFFAYLFGEVYRYSLQEKNYTFLCHNNTEPKYYGNYIRDEYFCDGVSHCDDGEDEQFGCELKGQKICGEGKFTCDNGQCKSISARCNTIKDCHDGTDELNCGDEIDVKNCTSEDKFLCKDGLRCLSLDYTCNKRCNCFDCSDENENCSKSDDNLLNRCPRAYFVTANGPQCFCASSNAKFNILCDGVERCENQYIFRYPGLMSCEQRCIKFKTKKQCACYEGYSVVNGTFGFKCRTAKDFAILYTNGNEIKYVNNTFLETSTILHGISNCTLLTAANNYVYYATSSRDNRTSIFKMALHSGKPEELIETDFAITSMAVDYITNNIYFTGGGSLSVCTSDGRICSQLKCCDVDFMTLAPKSGWMYYMKKQLDYPEERFCRNKFLLTRSNMDGSNETVHREYCFSNKIPMEMDESKNEINLLSEVELYNEYTHLYRIHVDSVFEDDNMRMKALLLTGIRSFSFHDDEIFYTLNGARGIFYFKNMTSSYYLMNRESLTYLNDTSSVTDVYVYNEAIQLSNENPCEKSPCSGLCLVKPETHLSKKFLSHTCFCDGFTPNRDDPWCSNDSHAVFWVITGVSILIILYVAAYVFRKLNWCHFQRYDIFKMMTNRT